MKRNSMLRGKYDNSKNNNQFITSCSCFMLRSFISLVQSLYISVKELKVKSIGIIIYNEINVFSHHLKLH